MQPWRCGTVQPVIQPIPLGSSTWQNPTPEWRIPPKPLGKRTPKKPPFQCLGIGCSPESTPNRFLTLVFLVSRTLFLSLLPTLWSPATPPTSEERPTGTEADQVRIKPATPPKEGSSQVGFLQEKLAKQYLILREPSTSEWPEPAG